MRCFHSSDPASAVSEPERNPCIPAALWRRRFDRSRGDDDLSHDQHQPLSSSSAAASDPPDPPPSLPHSGSQRPEELRVFSYLELKSATRNFNRGNLLGEGGFGCVYSATIRRGSKHGGGDGGEVKSEVAVKQLNQKGLQGHKEWLAEVNFLGRVEHLNLVKLIGYCAEDDSRGIQRLLVYEFMPNKSLDDHLFTRLYPVLPWQTRVRIALGAARGLAYLHEEMDIQVIYRDFKTANVLLDNDFNPKLSDFGLARQGPGAGVSHVTTAIVGTIGYAAPEYLQTGHLTTKSDVWSFGIVLLELLTGRRSMDRNRPRNEQRLLDWVRPYLKDGKKFSQLLDPRLDPGTYSIKVAYKFAALASKCLQKQPRARPRMGEIAESLKTILELSELPPSPRSVANFPAHGDDHLRTSQTERFGTPARTWSLKEVILSLFTTGRTAKTF